MAFIELSENIVSGQTRYAELHNKTNKALNTLKDFPSATELANSILLAKNRTNYTGTQTVSILSDYVDATTALILQNVSSFATKSALDILSQRVTDTTYTDANAVAANSAIIAAASASDRDRTNRTDTQAISTVNGLQSALDTKVAAISGKVLSSNDYTSTEQAKLAGIATGATVNATDAQLRDRASHTGTKKIATVNGLQLALDSKVATVAGKQLSTEDYTTAEKSKVAGIASGATMNSTDAILKNRANHTGTQLASTESDFTTQVQALIPASGASAATPSNAALAILYAGLVLRKKIPCRLAFAGSSTTAGNAASIEANRYMNLLVGKLQAAYPSGSGSEVM